MRRIGTSRWLSLLGASPVAIALGLSLFLLSPSVSAQTAEQLEKQYGREAMQKALETKHNYDLYGIHFDVDQATIRPETQPLFDDIAQMLKNFPVWRLSIVGHTDSTGDAARNQLLSLQRANAVKLALVDRGIQASRLETEGAGETQPVASNDTPEGRALNRRVALMRLDAKPNILVIWGDDIGWYNISAYNMGVMGYRTPNIDRLAREGALFTDWYAQQSCTAGRAAFLTGQSPIRTGLTKVGLPGTDVGLRPDDPTIAELLKPLGYATGQFGKNHLGDRDEFLPTAHGFDEFFGNLYHLNTQEEPENVDYPKDPEFKKKFGPRGVIHSVAGGKIEDTGPLTKKRMETVDEEITARALAFMEQQHKAGKPFFVWWNSTRMHIWTHLKKDSAGKTGLGIYPDGMVEHDAQVGELLKKLDELGIADNTIVMYSTDNGAETFTWPDGGTTPFRGEKTTNWEGGYRVPTLMRWPGTIKPGSVYNDVFAHEDMLPTILAAAGVPDVKETLLKGYTAGSNTFKVHLDGYDLAPYFKGEAKEAPRKEFLYWNDDGKLVALRYDRWKLVFSEQRGHGFGVWEEPFVDLRLPALYDLRADPFERASHESIGYSTWRIERVYLLVPAQAYVATWLASFKEFPPRQKPASFSLDQVMEKLTEAAGSAQ